VGNPEVNSRLTVTPLTRQILLGDLIDLSKNYKEINPPYSINFYTHPVYTASMWAYVTSPQQSWRLLMMFGKYDTVPGDSSNTDRTPGVYVEPSTNLDPSIRGQKMRIRVIHRVNSQGKNPGSWNEGTVMVNTKLLPEYGKWFHLGFTVKVNVMKVYINGILVATKDLKSQNPNYVYEWNQKKDKDVFLGISAPPGNAYTTPTTSPIYLQKVSWYNSELTAAQVQTLSKETITPTPQAIVGAAAAIPTPPSAPKTIKELLDNVTSPGVKYLQVGSYTYPVYVVMDPKGGNKGIVILSYLHKAKTNPELFVRQTVDGFPMFPDRFRPGQDGSTDRTTWGHLGAGFLNKVYTECGGFTKMLFAGLNFTKNKYIFFETSDPKAINYACTGKGSMAGMTYKLLPGHSSGSVPENAPNGEANKGGYALTQFPFYRSGLAHWGIRGNGNRWEVDDYSKPTGDEGSDTNTAHFVVISA
jgi:hypothetical protein